MGQRCASSDFFEVFEIVVILRLFQYLINVHPFGSIHLHEMLFSSFFDLLPLPVNLQLLRLFVQHLDILINVFFTCRSEEILMLTQ